MKHCGLLWAILVPWVAVAISCGSPFEIPSDAPTIDGPLCGISACECPDQHYRQETTDECTPCPDHALPPCEGGIVAMVSDPAVPGCDKPICECPDDFVGDGWSGCRQCPDYARPPCEGGTIVMVPDPAIPGCHEPICEHPLEDCRDGVDNDADSAVDCDDADCWTDDWCEDAPCGPPGLTECNVETVCDDGWDGDGDGKVDCADADCYTLRSAGCIIDCQSTDGTWDLSSCGHYWCGMPPDCLAVRPGCDCGVGRNYVDGLGCIEDSACPPPGDPCDSFCAPFTVPFATCTYPPDDTFSDPRCQNDTCAHEDVFGYSYCVGNQLWVHPACVVPLYCDPELAQTCPGPENRVDQCVCTCRDACIESWGVAGQYDPLWQVGQATCAGEDRLPIECLQISSIDLPVYSALVGCGAAPTEGTEACLVLGLDAKGTVTDVRAGTEGLQLTSENVDCTRNALVGMSAPSLAGESCVQTCEWGV